MLSKLGPAALSILLALSNMTAHGADDPPAGVKPVQPAEKPVDMAALEKAFAERMSGAVLAGSYSVTAGGQEKPAQMEKYTITKVSKAQQDYWLFQARIEYNKKNVVVPMLLQVKWAGDTPVITLTDFTIPGLGTFTSRVMIYGDRYAGTWQHGKTGGHLWGRVEKLDEKSGGDASEKPAGEAPSAPKTP